jgi:hypothetical protein
MNVVEQSDTTADDQIYLNREQAMKLLGVSRTTLATLVKRHGIQKCNLTRRPLYRRADLIQLIEQNMSHPKATKAAS